MMHGEGAVAHIQFLAQNLIDITKKEISSIPGLKKISKELSTKLEITQNFLNQVDMQAITHKDVKSWLIRFQDLLFCADGLVEDLNNLQNSQKIKTNPTKAKASIGCFSSFSRLIQIHEIVTRIRVVNKNLDHINREARVLFLDPKLVNVPNLPHGSQETRSSTTFHPTNLIPNPFLVGMKHESMKLVNVLTKEAEEKFSIHAIVGMGGIGKTKLAKSIFNHENIATHFQSRIWVYVSQDFNPLTIFKGMLTQLDCSDVVFENMEMDVTLTRLDVVFENMQMEVTLTRLSEALKDKTYLLVLDDLWNQNPRIWDNFMIDLSRVTSTKGNGIVVTTRSQVVSSVVEARYIHMVKFLSIEDSWCLIKSVAFAGEDCPFELENIGFSIASKCQGLPLTCIVLGSLMRSASKEQWIQFQQNSFPGQNSFPRHEGNIIDLLKLSFNSLSLPFLKNCFAYCSEFPEGQPVLKKTIITMWMKKGFLQPYHDIEQMKSLGDSYFNILVEKSLLQVVEKDDHGNIESCVMHDLVRDLAHSVIDSVSDPVFSSFEEAEHEWYVNGMDDDLSCISKKIARYLLTLTIKGVITDETMFSSFKSLLTFRLECEQVRELPGSIRMLIRLKNLDISMTSIEYLPDWISELNSLQTLNASTESLKELPSTIKCLINLEHLYILSHVKVPEIGKLVNLQEVEFTISNQNGYTIKELGNFKNLKELDIYNVEKVCDEEEARKAKLFEKENLNALRLEWDANREGQKNDESVLEGLQPHPDLIKLVIKGFGGERFPSWPLTVSDEPDRCWGGFKNLKNITLSGCQRCQEFPTLGSLPMLKSLQLWSLRNVKSISSSFCKIDSSTNGAIFPKLENILLSNMPELEELAEEKLLNGVEVFPCLQSLKIFHCNNLERLPSWLFHVACSLSELDIRRCSKLRQLSDGLGPHNRFKSITIKGCQNLKSIAGDFSCLNSLEICDCPELVEIVESEAPYVKKVCMAGLNSLLNLPELIDTFAKSSFLQELSIVGIRKFKSSSRIEEWCFSGLHKLEMDVSRDEWSSESVEDIKKTVDGVLQSCGLSLCVLKLIGLQTWESLIPIKHLTGLNSLELENLGVTELPEWLKDFKSLTRLCLSNCTKLRFLPSLEAMESLAKLQELRIRDCPELRIGSERYKIRHVRNIYFNGYSI